MKAVVVVTTVCLFLGLIVLPGLNLWSLSPPQYSHWCLSSFSFYFLFLCLNLASEESPLCLHSLDVNQWLIGIMLKHLKPIRSLHSIHRSGGSRVYGNTFKFKLQDIFKSALAFTFFWGLACLFCECMLPQPAKCLPQPQTGLSLTKPLAYSTCRLPR